MTTPEGAIENAIFRYLRMRGIMAWKQKTQGTYDPVAKRFRKLSANSRKGVSDIMGVRQVLITPDMVGKTIGALLAIEVKSQTGTLTPKQKLFLREVLENGGIAMVARSPLDVEKRLGEWEPKGAA